MPTTPRWHWAGPTRRRRAPPAITGAGYGQFSEILLKGVNAGDIIAMRLDNLTTGAFFWAFANANEKVNGQAAAHLMNQGLNT